MIDADTAIADVVNHPLLEGYGRFLFPVTLRVPQPGDRLSDVPALLPWYSNVRVETTVDVVTDLLERRNRGERVFYDLYTEAEKAADPSLADTGMFVFRARPAGQVDGGTQGTTAAPGPGQRPGVALCCAGGGFAYVASIHDSMPHALWLSRHGYTAVTVQYRPDPQLGCQDLARAVTLVHDLSEELGADPQGYSLWGGSAGARLAAWLGRYGPQAFGEPSRQAPAAVVTQYTGYREASAADPPTYACVGTRDSIASWTSVRDRLQALSQAGVPTRFQAFEGLSHGFGLGVGTVAEGWIAQAAGFWDAQRAATRS